MGARWVGLVAFSGSLAFACGDSASPSNAAAGGAGGAGGAQAQAGSSNHGGNAPSGGGSAAHAGNPGVSGSGNGNAGSGNGSAGANPSGGGTPGAGGAGAPGGGSAGAAPAGAGAAGAGGASTGMKSAGCGKPAPLAAPTQQSVMVDGKGRSYYLAPPAPYDSNTPYAVVFAFHGLGADGGGFRGYFGLEQASGGKAIFVYPDGLGGAWDLGNNGPDAKLFDSILATLSANWCVDTTAVFAAGFSYGGWAATQMATARPNVVRAIASIEGGGPQGASNNDGPVAAMIIHGTNDTAEPISSGMGSRDHFLKIDGCGTTTSAITPAPCVTYAGCKAKKSVAWCAHTGVHEIPAFAPAGIWSFFSSVR